MAAQRDDGRDQPHDLDDLDSEVVLEQGERLLRESRALLQELDDQIEANEPDEG